MGINVLIDHVKTISSLTDKDVDLLQNCFVNVDFPSKTLIVKVGQVERYLYFLTKGIVKGYQNFDGKLVIQHLNAKGEFFTSIDSFMNETPSVEYFESVNTCSMLKISKPDFELLQAETSFWDEFVNTITNRHIQCKMERTRDFHTLTAKERYLKFLEQKPHLVSEVPVENIASFLGMEIGRASCRERV